MNRHHLVKTGSIIPARTTKGSLISFQVSSPFHIYFYYVPLISCMFIGTECEQRETVGLQTLREGPIDHCPQVELRHIIRCAILGSPNQMLKLGDIRKAVRLRFGHFVKKHDWWPVSGSSFISSSFFGSCNMEPLNATHNP